MSNVNIVRAIGAGERKLGETADMLTERANGELDYSVKGVAASEATRVVREWLGPDADERQNNPDKSKTDFGRGFGSLVSAVKNRLTVKGETDWLRLVTTAAKNAANNGHTFEDVMLAAKLGADIETDDNPE